MERGVKMGRGKENVHMGSFFDVVGPRSTQRMMVQAMTLVEVLVMKLGLLREELGLTKHPN